MAFDFIDVNGAQVTLAAGGDIKAEAINTFGGKDLIESVEEEAPDLILAAAGGRGTEFAELVDNLSVFEVDPGDLVIAAATLDGRPFNNVVGGGAGGVAHVALLEDGFFPSPHAAIRQKGLTV